MTPKKPNLRIPFIFLAGLSIILIIFSGSFVVGGVRFVFEEMTNPVRAFEFSFISKTLGASYSDAYKKLLLQNRELSQKLVNIEKLQSENKALRDQYETGSPKSTSFLPAKIIGSPNFIPGVTNPTSFIVDRGQRDGIRVGQVGVYKDNFVGVVSKVSSTISRVDLITSGKFSFTVKTVPDELSSASSLGVIHSGETSLTLDNVVLSDKIFPTQVVVTRGDVNEKGEGIPPDLIVGKISSVNKKGNELFQKAEVNPLINYSDLTDIFIKIE